MSLSSKNIHQKYNFFEKDLDSDIKQKPTQKIKKFISLQNNNYEKEIFRRLNEGCILNFIRNSERKDTLKTAISETDMKYELYMVNKFDENLDSNLSFISEFNLEEGEKEFDSSFNSCDNDISVEQIEIIDKSQKKILDEKEEEDHRSKLEQDWNDIQNFLLKEN